MNADGLLESQRVRREIRDGRITGTSRGLAPGFVQCNLAIMPKAYAFDFMLYCQRNQRACPVLEVTDPGDPVPRTFHGGYGVTPLFPPQLTPTATRTHAVVAALKLCRRHGLDCEDLKDDVYAAVAYLLRAQLRPEDAFRLKRPEAVLGAFPERDGWLLVRPDYVSYAGRALLAARELLPS